MPQVLNPNDKNSCVSLSSDLFSATAWPGFGSVRALEPVPLDSDCRVYYYEVKVLLAESKMQIGWATKECFLLDGSGDGVGDDRYSIAFEASIRKSIWHGTPNGTSALMVRHPISMPKIWTVGDIVGCLIDVEQKNFIFYLNGHEFDLRKFNIDVHFSDMAYYPAVSFCANEAEQAYFNFGQQPFQFAPKGIEFRDFYGHSFNLQLQQSLKLGPDSRGRAVLSCDSLSVRNISCTSTSMETLFGVKPIDPNGVAHFYEVRLLTDGFMKIGWAVDEKSLYIGFDGYLKRIWLNFSEEPFYIDELAHHDDHRVATRWAIGDTLGCLLDVAEHNFIFYHNGQEFNADNFRWNVHFLTPTPSSYRLAISLSGGQQVYCNFGQKAFLYPPDGIEYQDFAGNRFNQALCKD